MSFVAHFSNSTTTSATSNTVTVSGVQANDIAVLCAYIGGSSAAPAFPSGFTAISGLTNANVATTDGTCTAAIKAKVCAGGETSFQVTWTGANLSTLVCRIYRGRNTSSTFTATSQTTIASTGMSFSPTITGLTAAAGDDIALFVPFQQTPSTTETLTFTAPTGYANSNTDVAAATANSPGVGSCDKVNVSAGATGNFTCTLGDNQGLSTAAVAFLLSIAKAPPGITKVQSTTASITDQVNPTIALTGVTAGNFLTLVVSASANSTVNGSTGVATPIDSLGNTWLLAQAPGSVNQGSTSNPSIMTGIAFCRNVLAGTHTVTCSLQAGWSFSDGYLTLTEWSGLGQGASPDVASFTNATTAQANTVTTATTASAQELVIAAVTVVSNPGVTNAAISDPPGAFTSLNVNQQTSVTQLGIEHSFLTTSTTGSQSAAWTWTDAGTLVSQGVVVAFTGQGSATNVYYRPGAQFVDESVIQL